MFKNYLKIAWRNVLRNKLFSFINIMGLAIGLACSILILLWVQDEWSFDNFHENSDDIYRVLQHMPFTEETTWAVNQGPLDEALKNVVPEIIESTKINNLGIQFKVNDNEFRGLGLVATPSFLKIFSFPLLQGDENTALSDIHSIILTEKLAKKVFGNDNPIGKSLLVYDQYDFIVSGVVKDPPLNSHLSFEFICTMEFAGEIGYSVDQWNNSTFNTYVLLQNNTKVESVNKKIENILEGKPTIETGATLSLQPLLDIHLTSGIDYDDGGTGNKQYVIIFFTSAIFILIIACINFMNLSTAQATRRALEVGLRKAIGANKYQLAGQFLFESFLMTLLSFILALFFIESILPFFNEFSAKELNIHYLDPDYFIPFSVLMLLTSILAGAYPAIYVSSFQPIQVLKGVKIELSGNSGFRKLLVILQFSISIILLVGTVAVYTQVNYMQNKSLGFDQDNLIYIHLGDAHDQLQLLKNDLLSNSNISSVAGSSPFFGFNWSNNQWEWEGKQDDILFRGGYVDFDYYQTFGIEMSEGRDFSEDFPSDSSAIIINETALKMMGLEDPVGKEIRNTDGPSYKIVGVVRDYNYRSLRTRVDPLLIFLKPQFSNYVWIRSSGNPQEIISFIESSWKKYDPEHEFQYGFMDERLENLYRQESRIGSILQAFSIMAVIILGLGLFGLLGFSVRQRYREISIKKVFGAGTTTIVYILSKGYLKLMLIAIGIAIPISNYIIRDWLNSFAYKSDITVFTFLLPSLGLILVSTIIVVGQSVVGNRKNVIEILRNQ